MAKKKKGKKSGKKSSGSKKSNMVDKLLPLAAIAFGAPKLEKIEFYQKLDPKMKAAVKIFGGDWLPKQSFASSIGTPAQRETAGNALMYEGVKELMISMNISGIGAEKRKVRGNEFLAVSIEGLEKGDTVNSDVLADDYTIDGDGDIDTVNDDMDGDDDGISDDMDGDDDLSSVNDDLD